MDSPPAKPRTARRQASARWATYVTVEALRATAETAFGVVLACIRACWRLAEASRLGCVNDNARCSIESETIQLLVEAANVLNDLGHDPEESVSARDVPQRIFFAVRSAEKITTPQEVKAAIASEKSGQAKKAPRGACTPVFRRRRHQRRSNDGGTGAQGLDKCRRVILKYIK
jgi:hypothetical protein